ncbi:hypothetical protein E2C01_036866 [Portunus trituberculatus]|uniref:Uncharacterized protein n=1 Tax=Portunus trituberculatus TaxID=210409 RepID=A0A5B7FD47_PORTR|nr:hypothetical protein [Portunus trituberculatus]
MIAIASDSYGIFLFYQPQTRSSAKHMEESRERDDPLPSRKTGTPTRKAKGGAERPSANSSISTVSVAVPASTTTSTSSTVTTTTGTGSSNSSVCSNTPGGTAGSTASPTIEDSAGARKRGRKKKVEGELEPPT